MVDVLKQKERTLRRIVHEMESVVIGFSGGTDSTLLLRVAIDELGPEKVLAATALSAVVPRQERREAKELARSIGARHVELEADMLDDTEFSANAPNRCYVCKKQILGRLLDVARREGCRTAADATNLDDAESSDRPGLKALEETDVRSPLWEAGLRKNEVRRLSRQLKLPTYDKPPGACLATRIPYGERITREKLRRIERAEERLRRAGYRTLRVRCHGALARIELGNEEDPLSLIESSDASVIVEDIKKLGFAYVTLDLEGYRTGSMHETLPEEQ